MMIMNLKNLIRYAINIMKCHYSSALDIAALKMGRGDNLEFPCCVVKCLFQKVGFRVGRELEAAISACLPPS
jgi:hypothetical protein